MELFKICVNSHIFKTLLECLIGYCIFSDDSSSNTSQTILQELEGIDDDCDQHNIPFVKIDDSQLESLYGIKNPPSLGFYKKQVPKFYEGKFVFTSAGNTFYIILDTFDDQLVILRRYFGIGPLLPSAAHPVNFVICASN